MSALRQAVMRLAVEIRTAPEGLHPSGRMRMDDIAEFVKNARDHMAKWWDALKAVTAELKVSRIPDEGRCQAIAGAINAIAEHHNRMVNHWLRQGSGTITTKDGRAIRKLFGNVERQVESLAERFNELSAVVVDQNAAIIAKHAKPWHPKAVKMLRDNPNVSAREIANAVKVSPSTVTRAFPAGTFKRAKKGVHSNRRGAM